jgi:hypothetical protein
MEKKDLKTLFSKIKNKKIIFDNYIKKFLNIFRFKKGLDKIYDIVKMIDYYKDIKNKFDIIIKISELYHENIDYSRLRDKYKFNIYKFLYETFRYFIRKQNLYKIDNVNKIMKIDIIIFKEMLDFIYKYIILLNKNK